MTTTSARVRGFFTLVVVGSAAVTLAGCSLISSITGSDHIVDGEGEQTDVFTIRVGDCVNDAKAADTVLSVPVVDCAEAHDSEAYASALVPDEEFPGDEAIAKFADDTCSASFAEFVGIAYEQSSLDLGYYYPTEGTWADGDREVLCLVYAVEDDIAVQSVGTLEGSAR